jgi:glycosyltransferase involved in cell wall biosynthesis
VTTVAYYVDSIVWGGMEQMLTTLVAGLAPRWRPLLLHYDAPELRPWLAELRALGVRTLPMGGAERRPGVGSTRAILRHLQRERPAVFHAHLRWPEACSDGLVAAALARVPAIVATQQLFGGHQSRLAVARRRLVSSVVHRYVAVSEGVAQSLRETFHIAPDKITVIHNAIVPARFEGSPDPALRAALAGGGAGPVALTVARLDKQKGLPYLLEAAAEVRDVRFAIAGDGDQRERLLAHAKALGVDRRVRFLGHRADVAELLAVSDVFVLPSLFEGLPVSVLEAMAAGRPVVATDIPGTREAVEHGISGLLVPPANPGALASAIRAVTRDPTLADRLAKGGAQRVRARFGAESMVRRNEAIYDELLERHGRAARAA